MGGKPELQFLPGVREASGGLFVGILVGEWGKDDDDGVVEEDSGVACQLTALPEPVALLLPHGCQYHGGAGSVGEP